MARGLPLRRVSSIICGVPPSIFIGRERAINRSGRGMTWGADKRGAVLKSAGGTPMRWGNAEPSAW
jgi:hypothetical protein